MKGREKRLLGITQLLFSGFTQEKIAEKLNISISTVARDVKKIRKSSSYWLENIVEQDLPHIYRESVEGHRQDLMNLIELLEKPEIQNDIELQLQIRKQISAVRTEYIKQVTNAPIAWALDAFRRKHNDERVPLPTVKSLGGISGVVKPR